MLVKEARYEVEINRDERHALLIRHLVIVDLLTSGTRRLRITQHGGLARVLPDLASQLSRSIGLAPELAWRAIFQCAVRVLLGIVLECDGEVACCDRSVRLGHECHAVTLHRLHEALPWRYVVDCTPVWSMASGQFQTRRFRSSPPCSPNHCPVSHSIFINRFALLMPSSDQPSECLT